MVLKGTTLATINILSELRRMAVYLIRQRQPTDVPPYLVKLEETKDLREVRRIKIVYETSEFAGRLTECLEWLAITSSFATETICATTFFDA